MELLNNYEDNHAKLDDITSTYYLLNDFLEKLYNLDFDDKIARHDVECCANNYIALSKIILTSLEELSQAMQKDIEKEYERK